MTFKPGTGGTRCVDAQQTAINPRLQVEANRAHVTQNLAGRLLKGEVEAALSALCGSISKMRGKARLTSPCGSRNQNAAVAEKSFASQHAVESGHTAGDTINRCLMG